MKKIAMLALAAMVLTQAGCAMPSTAGTKTLGTGTSSYGAATATTTAAYVAPPTPADFSLQVIETSHKCFGSAGCSVTYRIVPTWVGPGTAPTTGSFTLIYEVVGLDDSQTGNIAVRNGKFATETGNGDTQDGVTLTARVTQVLED